MVTGTATKIDQAQSAWLRIRVTDAVGNSIDCDPMILREFRLEGRPESHTFTGVPWREDVVTVLNGDPGVKQVRIEVNGWRFTVAGLRDGEERTIDIRSAVTPGMDSTVTLTSHGKPGGTATVMIWDGNTQ